jgi:four helix bundle protein
MARVERFEDLVAWQKARQLRKDVFAMRRAESLRREFDYKSQTKRAAISIMSNVAEGFERGGRAEFAQFLSTAKASCAEVRSLLYVALDEKYISDADFKRLSGQAEEVARVIGGLRSAVVRQRDAQRGKPSVLSPQSSNLTTGGTP